MITIDIKSDMPYKKDAIKRLELNLKIYKKEKIVKVLHGYGSNQIGGAIKREVIKYLQLKKESKEIISFIPGEALNDIFKYASDLSKYGYLFKNDPDFKNINMGITYVILNI